jgi:WD40 repeat protein
MFHIFINLSTIINALGRMKKQSFTTKQFYHIFDCMFNERWLVPLLYEYYKQNIIVSGSHDRTIKVWDQDTGKVLRTLTEYPDIGGTAQYYRNGGISMYRRKKQSDYIRELG